MCSFWIAHVICVVFVFVPYVHMLGVLPPDDTTTTMDAGIVRMGRNCVDADNVKGFRYFKQRLVTFDRAFDRPPVVVASVHHKQLSPEHTFEVNTADVDTKGFALEVQRV